MRRWIKWYGIDWINSTARDELSPAERATFLDFVCLASYPGCAPGTFKVASWDALARKLNTHIEIILSTRDKCLPTRISVESTPEGLLVSISNWAKYQAPLSAEKPDNISASETQKSDNKTSPQRRGEERRGRRERDKSIPSSSPHPPGTTTQRRVAPIYPEWFEPITRLPGFLPANHTRALDAIIAACDVQGVSPGELMVEFAAYWPRGRLPESQGGHGWTNPVRSLIKTLDIQISKHLLRGGSNNGPENDARAVRSGQGADPNALEAPSPFAKYR